MKRKILWPLVLLLLTLLLCACGPISGSFDEETLYQKSCQVIELCNARDYQGLYDCFDPRLGEALPLSEIESQVGPIMDGFGEFEEFKNYATSGSADETTGEEYAVIAVRCGYSEGKATYTMTYTTDYYLVGLYVQ